MANNDIRELRKHLFETIESLRDPEKPLELDRAKAISQVAGVIIDSARVEVAYMKATGTAEESDFLRPLEDHGRARLPAPSNGQHKGLETGKNLGADPAGRPAAGKTR